MSNQHETQQNFPDASSGKTSDKFEAYNTESSKTDSGFISGEITSQEFSYSGPIEDDSKLSNDNRRSDRQQHSDEHHSKGAEKDVHMLIDSGVCLSENFSKISISKGLNDLDAQKKSQQQQQQPPVARSKSDDIPWKIYYEQNEDGDTHLHLAIAGGFVEVALALIRAAPHPRFLDISNDDCQTPLHIAVETRQHRIARWLIVAGCRPTPRDLHGESPLHIAARADDYLSVKAIADPVKQMEREQLALSYHGHHYQQCDFDQWNLLGQTCVHVAALHGNLQVLRHLVWYGANVNAREGCAGYSALHLAVERQDQALLQFLLQCQDIDPEIATYGGKTALEVNPSVSQEVMTFLRNKGVPTPYHSEDEDEDDDSEEEMLYENNRMFTSSMPLVNASA